MSIINDFHSFSLSVEGSVMAFSSKNKRRYGTNSALQLIERSFCMPHEHVYHYEQHKQHFHLIWQCFNNTGCKDFSFVIHVTAFGSRRLLLMGAGWPFSVPTFILTFVSCAVTQSHDSFREVLLLMFYYYIHLTRKCSTTSFQRSLGGWVLEATSRALISLAGHDLDPTA